MRITDALLLALCAMLVLSGPVMAALELVRAGDAGTGNADLVSGADHGYRLPWRAGLLAGILLTDALGCFVVVRVALQPKARAVATRLVTIMLAGMALLCIGFLLDARALAESSARIRAAGIVWAYPAAAVLVAGALLRLQEVESLFPEIGDPTPLSVRARRKE